LEGGLGYETSDVTVLSAVKQENLTAAVQEHPHSHAQPCDERRATEEQEVIGLGLLQRASDFLLQAERFEDRVVTGRDTSQLAVKRS
jgi:hypothetical protein